MITCDEFNKLMTLIENKTGITLPESNYKTVENYVMQTTLDLECTFTDYLSLVQKDHNLYLKLIDLVTINETYFFREEIQFQYLNKDLFPLLKEKNRDINIWSASCSTGEEALSVYSLANDYFPESIPVTVYASDICDEVLTKFKKGLYTGNSFRTDGTEYHKIIKSMAEETDKKNWQIDQKHLNNIRIRNINLFKSDNSTLPQMDIIFLRNTLIYMNQENKKIIVDNIVDQLKQNGILLLSISEVPLISHPSLIVEEHSGIYLFRKIDPNTLSTASFSNKVNNVITHQDPSSEISNIEALLERKRKELYKNLTSKKTKKIKSPAIHNATDNNKENHNNNKEEKDPVKNKLFNKETESTITNPENEICNEIAMRLNNKAHNKCEENIEEPTILIIQLLDSINRNNTANQEIVLSEIETLGYHIIIPGLYNFFLGYIRYHRGESDSAGEYFRKSLLSNKILWPSRYFLIQTMASNDSERLIQLQKLINEIEEYITNCRYDYQFLLEGFNARYFLLITKENYLKATTKGNKN